MQYKLTTPERVLFDPSNTDHRNVFFQYVQRGGWGEARCPFKLMSPYISVADMCRAELVAYYTNSEFGVTETV